uniref:AT-hook motif nuclear-localized protein 6-like isoform X2 n=1 Tax=Erigeron canadensis TaxID=72917 RepID=UPI001CB8EFB4|nr:AT-hook motif nuclear-localized protein 6-like isoform X2 [Erigeron canadensis]
MEMESKEDNKNHDSGTVTVPPAAVAVAGELNFGRLTAAPPLKKRGRPRKYGTDGKPTATLSPMPISASIPITRDYSSWKHSQGNNKLLSEIKRKQKLEFSSPGEQTSYSVCMNFTPHVLTVRSGEDVNMKIISFAQQGGRAICILAANGAISNVTLRQPDSSGGTLTYEGRFDILSLSGSFMSNNNGGAIGISGGMSVSLAGPDGRVLGGGLSGMLVAAGPIQVILGSFLPSHQHEQQNPKKSRFEPIPAISPPSIASTPIYKETTARGNGDESKISFTLTTPVENSGSLHASEAKVINTSPFEVSC